MIETFFPSYFARLAPADADARAAANLSLGNDFARPISIMPFRIGLRSRAIRIFIWSARTRTDNLLRSIRVAISAKPNPDIASRRSRSSSEGDHGIPLISFTFSPWAWTHDARPTLPANRGYRLPRGF
jgi:hypothetical protein